MFSVYGLSGEHQKLMDLQCTVTELLTVHHEQPQNSLWRTVENKTKCGKQFILGGIQSVM
jgi:hypothetical protein